MMKNRLDTVSRISPTFEQICRRIRQPLGGTGIPARFLRNAQRSSPVGDVARAVFMYRRGASLMTLKLG